MPADLSRRAGDALRKNVELGKIKVGCLAGMRDKQYGRAMSVSETDIDGMYYIEMREPFASLPTVGSDALLDPDTDDPLTVFGLLLLAREAWGDPGLWCEPDADDVRMWRCWSSRLGFVRQVSVGATESEAIVAALEAAVEARRG